MQRISNCFNKQLYEICKTAIFLDDLNRKISLFLPENLREHCSVGSFNKGCLIIVTSKPAFATELRYLLPSLRDELRKKADLYQLISIQVQIAADLHPKITTEDKTATAENSTESKLSTTARKSIQNAAEACTYEPLKEVLQRFGEEK